MAHSSVGKSAPLGGSLRGPVRDDARHKTEQVGGARMHTTISQKQSAKYMFN